jgi:hypothetical protein
MPCGSIDGHNCPDASCSGAAADASVSGAPAADASFVLGRGAMGMEGLRARLEGLAIQAGAGLRQGIR